MVSLRHLEHVVGGGLFMGQDERIEPLTTPQTPIVAPLDVSRCAKLAAFENDRSDLARSLSLVFDALVQIPLRSVENKRSDLSGLCSDEQAIARKELKVIPEANDLGLLLGC